MSEVVAAYYASRDPFGKQGDFVTAPEISQMFGEVLGAGLVDLWQKMESPKEFSLVELGPGRGTLMADILRVIGKIMSKCHPGEGRGLAVKDGRECRIAGQARDGGEGCFSLFLLENSPILKSAQARALHSHNPVWVSSLEELPKRPAIFVANEFFDALPIHQFQMEDGMWQERYVAYDDGRGFHFILQPADGMIAHHLKESFPEAKNGDVFELCPEGLAVMAGIARHIKKHGGFAVIIDYGHKQSGLGETLQAVRDHKYVPPLENPGEVDLTAHVDFGALAEVAVREGCRVLEMTTQGELLKGWGIEARAQMLLKNATPKQAEDIRSSLHRLTDPAEMGDLFKAMVVG